MKRRKRNPEITKNYIAMTNTFAYQTKMRNVCREMDELSRTRRLSKDVVAFLSASDDVGNEPFGPVDLLPHEYAAIRRYLIRNRRRLLKKEGLV